MAIKPPGGTKPSSSKPVAKTTVPPPPPTPVSAPTPATTAVLNSSVATAAVYVSKPTLKKHWIAISISSLVIIVFICGLALGGVFKKTPSEPNLENMTTSTVNEKTAAVKVNNPKIEFFSGVLECLPGKWTAPVYIRERLEWQAPGGVPYLYMFDENGQEIPCDGVVIPTVSRRVNSVKFKFLIKTVVVIEQVSFKKDTEVEKK